MSTHSVIGFPFVELAMVDSTNNYAMRMVHEGMAHHGTAVFAHTQNGGKGQRGRQWISEANNNLALSVVIEPIELSPPQLFFLSKTIAVATCKLINKYVDGEAKIKWPNDIYWRDRKAAGILIENVLMGSQWKFAIAGIGINVNQTHFKQLDSKAVSLKQITGKAFQPLTLAKELCVLTHEELSLLHTNWQLVKDDYHTHLYKRNEKVKLKKGSRVFEATVIGVTDTGQLIVEGGVEERFEVGEVEWVIE